MAMMSDLHLLATRVIETDETVEQVARESAISEADIRYAVEQMRDL